MKVNLKKAGALAAALAAVPGKFDHQFRIDPFLNPVTEEQVNELREVLASQLNAAAQRNSTVFKIRRLIRSANIEKIDGLLAARAEVEKMLSIFNSIPVRPASTNLQSLARQAEAMRGEQNALRMRELILELQTQDIVETPVKALRKTLRTVNEELQNQNYNTEIELPEDVVTVLRDYDLI